MSYLCSPQVSLTQLWMTFDIIRCAFGNNCALRQYTDAVSQAEYHVHIVLDDDLSHATLFNLFQQIDRTVGVVTRHTCSRLNQQQQLRMLNQTHRQLKTTLVTA